MSERLRRVTVIPDMTIAGRKFCLAILLGLLIGHASIALHAATHATIDAGDCAICLSHGDLTKAITGSPIAYPVATAEWSVAVPGWNQVPQPQPALVRQRSPPAVT